MQKVGKIITGIALWYIGGILYDMLPAKYKFQVERNNE